MSHVGMALNFNFKLLRSKQMHVRACHHWCVCAFARAHRKMLSRPLSTSPYAYARRGDCGGQLAGGVQSAGSQLSCPHWPK